MALLRDATAANLPTSLRWTFATVAARDAQSVTSTDVGRLAWITDTKVLCILESSSPVAWRALAADPYLSSSPTPATSTMLKSPDGTKWSVTVDNDGNLTTTEVA